MIETPEFYREVINSITDNIVVISIDGTIVFSNESWDNFASDNQLPAVESWKGINYLEVCRKAAKMGDEFGQKAIDGIQGVFNGNLSFYLEYPCHSLEEKRWFMMKARPLKYQQKSLFVISHQSITERKLIEEKILALSLYDGLTNVANRRYFDQFINSEWRRCARLEFPLSLAMFDIDHFKLYNDTYGHVAGDECLAKIAKVLNQYTRRPGDICARFSGEKFALLFGNTTNQTALNLVNNAINAIKALQIPSKHSPVDKTVTVSVGLATLIPSRMGKEDDLIKLADNLLYHVKTHGRNQVSYKDFAES